MNKIVDAFTVKRHFEGKSPTVTETYDQLLKTLRKFGQITEEPKKLRFTL